MKKRIIAITILVVMLAIVGAMFSACNLFPSKNDGEKEFKIEFVSNGGTSFKPQIIKPGANSFQMPIPERSGYKFDGWFTDKSFTETWTQFMQKSGGAISSDMILYARWIPITATISLNFTGGVYHENQGPFEFALGYELMLPIPTKTGCVFIGWFEGEARSSEKITEADGVLSKDFDKTGEITLYAHWDIKVNVLPNGSAGSIAVEPQFYILGNAETETVTFKATPMPHYSFKGWAFGSENGEIISNDMEYTYRYANDVEVYAIFEGKESTLKADYNYPEGSSETKTYLVRYGAAEKISPPIFDEYLFSGWFTAQEGGNRVSDKLGNITSYPYYEDATLYAQWKKGGIPTDYEYKKSTSGTEYVITGYAGSATEELYIPYALNDIPVTEIDKSFKPSSLGATKVVIPSSIKTISPESFIGYTGKIYFDRGFANLNLINSTNFNVSHNIYVHGTYVKEATTETIEGRADNRFGAGVNTLLIDDIYFNFLGTYADSMIDNRREFQAMINYLLTFSVSSPIAFKVNYTDNVQDEMGRVIEAMTYRHNTDLSRDNGQISYYILGSTIKLSGFSEKDATNRLASKSTIAPDTEQIINIVSSYTEENVEERIFEIDYANPYVVYNAEQMLYAVENGYKPVFLEGADPNARIIYQKAREAIRKNVPSDVDAITKVTIIHDWIANNNKYDFNLLELSKDEMTDELIKYRGFYLEGMFLDGHSVCDGISKALAFMCWIEGIESARITGEIISNSENHAWNKVKIDNVWYSLDLTANDLAIDSESSGRLEMVTHRYFLISDNQLATRNREEENNIDPFYTKHTSTGNYNYFTSTSYTEGKDLFLQSNVEKGELEVFFNQFINSSTKPAGQKFGVEYIYNSSSSNPESDYSLTNTTYVGGEWGLTGSYFKVCLKNK